MKKNVQFKELVEMEFYFTFTFFFVFFIRFVAMFNNVFLFQIKIKILISFHYLDSDFDFAGNSIKSDDTDYNIILMTDRKQNPRKF